MTLSTTTNRISYSGNGSTTVFSFPYYFLANSDLVVVSRVTATGVETVQVITTNYTVSGAGVSAGGSVTMLVAPAVGETLTIYRDPAKTQDLDLVENDPMPAEEIEERFDKAMMIAQRLSDRLDRAIVLKATDSAATLELPLVDDRASLYLAFDASGDIIASPSAIGTPITAYIATLVDDVSATDARTTLGFAGSGGTVQAGNIEADAVTTVKILNGNVTRAKLATGAIAPSTVTAKTTTYTATTSDDFIACSTSGGGWTLTLPAASSASGRILYIKKTTADTNVLLVDGNASETIDGDTTKSIDTQYESLTIICDGSNWHVL